MALSARPRFSWRSAVGSVRSRAFPAPFRKSHNGVHLSTFWGCGKGLRGRQRVPRATEDTRSFSFHPCLLPIIFRRGGSVHDTGSMGKRCYSDVGHPCALNVCPGTPRAGSRPGQARPERLRLGREWPSSWAGNSPGKKSLTFPSEPCFSTTSTKGPGERGEILSPKRQHGPSP